MSAPRTHVPDLTPGRTWPELDTFTVLARDRRIVPVVRRLIADGETPVGVYRKLAGDAPGTFLLESAEHGGVWSRWSIIGAQSRATLTERDGQAHWIGEPPVGVPTDGDPTAALRATLEALATDPVEGLPPLTGGMVGAITYDAVRRWERVPSELPDVLGVPELGMVLPPTWRCSTTATDRSSWWPMPSTTTTPTSGSRRRGRTPSTVSTR